MEITKMEFGKTKEGEPVYRYTIHNRNGMSLSLLDYGASMQALLVPDKDGRLDDVVLGYDTVSDYETNDIFMGGVVGRYANRIENGRFSVDGTEYQLTLNDGSNHLHGGLRGWHQKLWRAAVDSKAGFVKFEITSDDGDQGYPGKVTASVTYQLTDDNTVVINFTANVEGKPTPINLCSHAYYNLAGHKGGSIYDHHVTIFAKNYLPVDTNRIPTAVTAVKGTPFDLQKGVKVGDVIHNISGGFDNTFCLSGPTGKRHAASVRDGVSGRVMDVYTNQPGVQFYSGNFLSGNKGKDGAAYNLHSALCLETQNYPNAPNEASFPGSILQPDSTYLHQSWFKFHW